MPACHPRLIRYIRPGMKPTTLFAAAAAGLFLSSVSCERHSWEETKVLHEKHGHGAHAEGEHKDGEHKDEKHADEHPVEGKSH